MAAVQEQAKRYLADRHAFRQEQIVLPNGRTFGEAEEPWQRELAGGGRPDRAREEQIGSPADPVQMEGTRRDL